MIFNVIFTLEALIKIFALRCLYFKEAWNVYDFTIVVTTYLILILEEAKIDLGIGSTTTILRTLRVGRIIRLISKAWHMKTILYTLLDSW